MKNDQIRPELVRLFVALDEIANVYWAMEENGSFLKDTRYIKEAIELSNNLGDARFHLSELINIDIIERAKAAKTGIKINSEF